MLWTARGSLAAPAVALALAALCATPAAAVEPRTPGPRDACPVCGMFVAPHSEWAAQVVFADGTAAFFDGCKDLFKFLSDRGRYASRRRPDNAEVAAVFVTGYYDRQPLAARDALFVAGSDVLGPMGAELVPLAGRDEAEEFLRDHRGTRILRFDEVTETVIENLH